MGGKKKKSALQAATSVAPSAAAGRAAAAEDPTKQAANNKPVKPAKENKSKAPKTYSLANTAQVDTGGVTDKSILKVSIQADLEKKIIKLINDFREENGDKGPISGRLTNKKLLDLYTALQKFSFKREHIEEAMKSSVLYGGDLHSALDWLCLNLKDEELPEGFTQQMQEESQKSRPKFQPPAQEKAAAPSPKAPSIDRIEPTPVRLSVYSSALAKNHVGCNTKSKLCVYQATEKDEAASMKDWILRYAEQSSDEEEEEEEEDKIGKKTHNPELDEKFDPNDRYLGLTAQLYDAKDMAAVAKTKGDKAGQRMAQDRIRIIQQEMKPLESHPVFNPALKVVDGPQKDKKTLPASEEKADAGMNLFEQAEKALPAAKAPVAKKNEPKDIRNFDYTARSWTGKSPKQFLIDWVRKNLPKSPAPAFHKVAAGRYWRSKVSVQRTEDVLEVCPTILTEDSMQAQHLAATLALYTMIKGQSVHQLLPPTYRDVWLEWRDSEQQQKEESRTAANKPRDQFISRLLTRLKQQQSQSQDQEFDSQGQLGLVSAGDEEPEESWENLAGLDIGEAGQEPEDKSEKRARGEGALAASREILMKLKKSPMANKLKAEREQLPVFQHRYRVLEALQRHPVVVVAGETGSGKSTQIPQFLLEELLTGGKEAKPCNIVSSLCGYQIRMENQSGEWTRLLYCTTGVLLRKLQHDKHLSSLTHIIVDEVHERSVQSDFLLTILKDVVMRRSDLQLILMSATVDCDKFSNYFNRCPVISIPGRTFPVEVFHLEDIVEQTGYVLEKDSEYCQKILEDEEEVSITITQKGGKTGQHQEVILRDSSGWDLGPDLDHFSSRTRQMLQYMNPNKINMDLLIDLIDYLDKSPQFAVMDGAVLVFLPGLAHIQQLHDLLTSDKRFRDKNRYHESSQMSSLVETFVSKASALQRQGRAGRVRHGFCFRLYPKSRFNSFMDYAIPEILRVPLEELCLHIMVQNQTRAHRHIH
ncbi:ATP-dependent RNA helicase DHX29 [Liparis tanakae]|uniref:ATP-dependent RNA helicase DHX29 n=1 Tax=Liparis tanakae TaxID=230148 RepID=A0A4Z2GZL4_9TELE|nr:ATP-dependent RNA helicase DHX29 [Liparis tanakae]